MNQSNSQSQHRDDNPRKMSNPYSKNQQSRDSPNNTPNTSKYSSSRPYQPQRDYRNNNTRDRSRSRDMNQRQSFHGNQYNNMDYNLNNYDSNNQRNKPYYYRQNISDHNNQRQFESKFNKDKNNNSQNLDKGTGGHYNSSTISKDDCLILLQKNYFNYIMNDFNKLKSRLKSELKDDISNIIYNFQVPNYSENIFKFTSYSDTSKFTAIKIISEYLFDELKKMFDKSTYLKLSFLIPDNVIGFIIGIEGKNINQIREKTNAKIEVYSQNNSNYRKIEISGDPRGIAGAAEKIYSITKKYFYFNNPKILNRNERDRDRDRREMDHERDNRDSNRDRDRDFNSYKDRGYNGYRNKDYNNMGYKDKDYKGMYNKERNEYRDMGYKNDYKGREGYRNNNYNNNRDLRKSSRDYYDKNDGYYRDNYRDNGPRYKNNMDRNNGKYYYEKNKNNNSNGDNGDSRHDEIRSRRSYSSRSRSDYSRVSYSNNYNNNDDYEKRERSDEDNNNNISREENNEDQNKNIIKNEDIDIDKSKLEPGEENNNKDSKEMNNSNINEPNKNENVNNNDNVSNNFGDNIDNKINNSINNIDNNNNINNNENKEGKNIETQELNNILTGDDDENDSKLCTIIIYLSSEEINHLNTLKNNIWINLENSYHCSITKIIKNIDEQEISLITFKGTPKQNTLALYQLQKYLTDTKNVQTDVNEKDN